MIWSLSDYDNWTFANPVFSGLVKGQAVTQSNAWTGYKDTLGYFVTSEVVGSLAHIPHIALED